MDVCVGIVGRAVLFRGEAQPWQDHQDPQGHLQCPQALQGHPQALQGPQDRHPKGVARRPGLCKAEAGGSNPVFSTRNIKGLHAGSPVIRSHLCASYCC
jgi:hypothetical protein